MAQYEDRWINGSRYTVPVGTRADWKPGQPYVLSSTNTTKTSTPKTTAPAATSTSKSSYQAHLDWFGSPEKYAAEIKRKEAAGARFDDPAAAADFKKAYPYLFSAPTAGVQDTRQRTVNDILPQLQQTISRYSFPYEQLLRDLMSQAPAYKMPSEAELLQQAQQYADLQVSPLLSAIQSSLANTQTAYENERAAIEAAYAGVPARTQALLDEARRNAQESAIARGMGRSGVVDWQTEKLSAPILQQATQSEQEKAAKLAAIANTLAAAQSEAERQRQETESRRGTLQGARLAELRQQAAENALREMAARWGQGINLAQLAQAANTSQQNLLAQLLPLFMYG